MCIIVTKEGKKCPYKPNRNFCRFHKDIIDNTNFFEKIRKSQESIEQTLEEIKKTLESLQNNINSIQKANKNGQNNENVIVIKRKSSFGVSVTQTTTDSSTTHPTDDTKRKIPMSKLMRGLSNPI